jgi:hypothetical protein
MATVKFQNGDIRENGQLLGKLKNDEIRDKHGTLLCKTRNDEIRSPAGVLIGKIHDGCVYSASSSRLGHVNDYLIDGMQHEKDVNIVAAYHFFVKKFF